MFGRLLRAHPGAQPDDVRVQAVLTCLPEGWPACRDAGVLIEIVDVEETLHQDRERMNCKLMDANDLPYAVAQTWDPRCGAAP